jgi:hypothetical protein
MKDGKMSRLEEYFNELRTRGERLPAQFDQRKPNFRAISAASGIDYKYLRARPFKQRITLAVKEIGLTSPEISRELKRQQVFEKNHILLNNYLSWLDDHGYKLPEDPLHRGKVFYRQVEIEAGMSPNALIPKNTESDNAFDVGLGNMLINAASWIGLEVRVLTQSPGQIITPFTYEQLLHQGSETRKIELEHKPHAQQQLYNTRAALNHFLKSLGLEKTVPVGSEMMVDFKKTVEKVTGRIRSDKTRKKFQTEIRWWQSFYQRVAKEGSIPGDFHEAVAYLVDRSGLPLSLIAKLVGVSQCSLRSWYQAKTTPSSLSGIAISEMERLFKLPTGALLTKIPGYSPNWRFRISQLPGFLRQDQGLAKRVLQHLPSNFCELPLNKQKEIAESIDNDVVRSSDPYTRKIMVLRRLPYSLREWPIRLEEEFNDLATFKTEDRPPLGMKRNEKWRPTTRDKIRRDLEFFFGALRLPSTNEDQRLCGLGVPVEHVSLAFIACPLVLDWYIRFRARRTQYTQYMIDILENFRALLRPDTGWIRQKPELAARLQPICFGGTEVVSQRLISRAHTDWDAICDEARKYFKHLIKELKPMISIARDPFSGIEGVLKMDDPLSVFKIIADGIRKDLPNQHTQAMRYHTAIRDCTLILLICVTGFRIRTISLLNYTGHATGQLFKMNNTYMLNVPRGFFKEEDSPFFGPKHAQKDYVTKIPNIFGLHQLLDMYLTNSRPWLLGHHQQDCKEHPLFVTSPTGKSVRLLPINIYYVYRKAFSKYLAENKWRGTGIPRVRATGTHSARHIRGTHIAKRTGSFQLAADANHNSEKMARRHYTQFLPEDRNKRVNEVLFKDKMNEKDEDVREQDDDV